MISAYLRDMEAADRKREVWCKTCMLPITYYKYGINPCGYCGKEATHTIHGGNKLITVLDLQWDYCSEACLQGAILKAIFEHNLTSKRFLSLISTD